AMLRRTLQAGAFDEYGLPAFEEVVDQGAIKIERDDYGDSNLYLTFPSIVVSDKVYAHVIGGDGKVKKHELRLPKKCEVRALIAVGDDLAVRYRDQQYEAHFYWASDPATKYECGYYYRDVAHEMATVLKEGGFLLGKESVGPGEKQMAEAESYFHDGERF